jgi:hypothetical protein
MSVKLTGQRERKGPEVHGHLRGRDEAVIYSGDLQLGDASPGGGSRQREGGDCPAFRDYVSA